MSQIKRHKNRCKLNGCESYGSTFSVPYNSLRKQWIEFIEKYQEFDYRPIRFFVCEKHFEPHQIIRIGSKNKLKAGTVPTRYLKT